MTARAEITAAVKHERTRNVVIFIAEHEGCSIKDIGLALEIDKAVALRSIQTAVDHHHCNITYTTRKQSKGGVTYNYTFIGISKGKGSLTCVDKPMDREYTTDQLDNIKATRQSNAVIEILEVFDAHNEYLTMQELADIAGIPFTAFRVRVQSMERSIQGLYIHRMGPLHDRRFKLVSLTRYKEKRNPRIPKLNVGGSLSLLNSVFR